MCLLSSCGCIALYRRACADARRAAQNAVAPLDATIYLVNSGMGIGGAISTYHDAANIAGRVALRTSFCKFEQNSAADVRRCTCCAALLWQMCSAIRRADGPARARSATSLAALCL